MMTTVRQKQYFLAALVCAALLTGFEFLCALAPAAGRVVSDWLQILAPIAAGKYGLDLARRNIRDGESGRKATGWLLIAVGALTWASGQVVYTYYELGLRITPPFPGLPEIGYLGSYLFTCSGLSLLFERMPRIGRLRLVLDSAVATSGIAIASWYFVVERLWLQSGVPVFTKLVNLAFPLCDIVTLFIAITLVSGAQADRNFRRAIGFVTVGAATIATADTGYCYYNFSNSYHTGLWTDAFWIAGWASVALAFALQLRTQKAAQQDDAGAVASTSPSLMSAQFPYVAATIVCIALMANDYVVYDRLRLSTFAATYIVIALVVFRQVFTLQENQILTTDLATKLAENRQLTERLREFNDGLELVVERRAQQLSSLHRLTKAVHTSQDVDYVLETASAHTVEAMQATTVAVWLREEPSTPGAPAYCLSYFRATAPLAWVERFVKCFLPLDCEQTQIVPIIDPRRAGDPRRDSADEQPSGFGAMLCAPLRFRERALGMLAVTRELPEEASAQAQSDALFDQSDRDLLESICIEVATALHNARQFAQARNAADRDPVTNLFNHRAIHERLDEEIAIAKLEDHPLSVMMMDLNDFKLFNDTYGHPVGDEVLRHVAATLKEENPAAICGRYGGDEFLVLAPRAKGDEARSFAERLRQRLISEGFRNPAVEDGAPVPIAISFGVALYPEDSTNRHELLTLADANLYKAKNSESGIGLTNTAQRMTRRLRAESSFSLLDAMVTSIDNKDKYTRRHSEDVTKYALWLAQELRLSDETMRIIRIGGLLHDVGKIGIPEQILRKPGTLTTEEYEAVKQHPNLGAVIVGSIPGMEGIVDAVRYHHERWDGRGYPDRLSGTDIPMIGRIMSVADAYSAMTTNRPYRAGMDWQTALAEIQRNIGTQFDPLMARAFVCTIKWRMELDQGKNPSASDASSALDEPEADLPLAA